MQLIAERFELGEFIAQGGMGAVYRGSDRQTGQTVAIKSIRPELVDAALIARFQQEGETLRTLNHPNIVKLVATAQQGDQHFLVMEYVSGGSLADLLTKQSCLDADQTVSIALELADALARAHHLKIIHRDLKPANVLLAEDGTPRLTDFGVARTAQGSMTSTGVIVGTLSYLAPETLNGEPADARADIWAFGVTLFELLTGRLPFRADSPAALITAILTQPMPDLEAIHPDLPVALVDLIYRMLDKDPRQRIGSMRQIAAELETIREQRSSTTVSSPQDKQRPNAAALVGDSMVGERTGLEALRKSLHVPKAPYIDDATTAEMKPDSKPNESLKRNVIDRAAMLNKVYDFWIKGVLEPAKLGDVWLDLPAGQRPEAVEPEIKRNIRNADFDSFSLGSDKRIIDVFHRVGNELLILGAPGAGKTITLLELARDLIVEAQSDRSKPIPVVLNLSSWAEKHSEKLEEWLVERLFTDYGVSHKFGKSWVENGNLLFLFDGLDEVAESYRDTCVKALNTFWRKYDQLDNGIAVCSRIADYENLTTTLHLEYAIMLDSLTPVQVEEYLAKLGKAWEELRVAIPGDPVLQELAQSPLLLNFLAVAYRDTPHEQIVGLSEDDQTRQLFDRYVVRRLREDAAPDNYPNATTRHCLSWLAEKMVEHKQTVFQIEGLQPNWLDTDQQRTYRHLRWLSTLFAGLFFVLIGVLVGVLTGALPGGLLGGRLGVLVGVLLSVLFSGLFSVQVGGPDSKIAIKDKLGWSLSMGRNQAVLVLVFGLFFGLFIGLSSSLFGRLVGLVFGLVGVLFIGLVGVLVGGLTVTSVEYHTHSNEGIWRSLTNWLSAGLVGGLVFGLIFGLVFGLIFGLIGGLIFGLVGGVIFGLVSGLVGGLGYGGSAVIKHFLLRRVLYRTGIAPWNYANFLDYCVSRQLMRRVGGGYIFRHRMLMEYFAQKNF